MNRRSFLRGAGALIGAARFVPGLLRGAAAMPATVFIEEAVATGRYTASVWIKKAYSDEPWRHIGYATDEPVFKIPSEHVKTGVTYWASSAVVKPAPEPDWSPWL